MKDVRITKKSDGTWGLSKTDGLFDWAEDGTQVAQHVTIRWNIFAKTKTDPGEYTLNNELPHKTDLGTKWYTVILDSKKSRAEKDFELKRVAMATTGVKQITKWNWTQTGHAVSIVGAGWTEWGEVDFSGDITPL